MVQTVVMDFLVKVGGGEQGYPLIFTDGATALYQCSAPAYPQAYTARALLLRQFKSVLTQVLLPNQCGLSQT